MSTIAYVTFDEAGNLTGFYQQELLPEHENAYLEVSPGLWMTWFNFRMNVARDGLEVRPPPPNPAPPHDPVPVG